MAIVVLELPLTVRPYPVRNCTGPYPPSLTGQENWQLVKLGWSDERERFSKTPISIRTSRIANSDGHGVPFAAPFDCLQPNTVLGYRQPDNSRLRLGLIDCDNCVAADGTISRRIQNLLRYMNTYAEYSVSGTGIHGLCWLEDVPLNGHKDSEWAIEFYWERNVVPITGNRVCLPDWESPSDVLPRTTEYLKLHAARFPTTSSYSSSNIAAEPCALSSEEILSLLFREPLGSKWQQVYDGQWHAYYRSPSDADLAMLIKLAFYSGKDPHMMDVIFSASPMAKILVRGTIEKPTRWKKPKWENHKYREMTIKAAIEKTASVYKHRKPAQSDQNFYRMAQQRIHERKTK